MRVLTVRQPWASAIVKLGKDVENRTRNLAGDYRGPVAIHASAREEPMDHWSRKAIHDLTGVLPLCSLPNGLGHIIGVVDLIDVHHDQTIRGDLHCCSDGTWHGNSPCSGPCSPWAMTGHHHLVLANPRPLLRPIPWLGALGLRHAPDGLVAAIVEQLGAVA